MFVALSDISGRVAMPGNTWRSPETYEGLRSLDAPGFAWQYLRRNPDFRQDCKRLARRTQRNEVMAHQAAIFADRWGVRFPGGAARSGRWAAAVDANGSAERRPFDTPARWAVTARL
jgi:hypothetical protein